MAKISGVQLGCQLHPTRIASSSLETLTLQTTCSVEQLKIGFYSLLSAKRKNTE